MNEALAHLDAGILIATTLLSVIGLKVLKKVSTVIILSFTFLFVQCLSVVVTRPLVSMLGEAWPGGTAIFFYFGFAFIDIAMIYVVAASHEYLRVKPNVLTHFVVGIYSSFALLQVARYFDRITETNVLAEIYVFAVPTLNLVMLFSLFVGFVVAYRVENMDVKTRIKL